MPSHCQVFAGKDKVIKYWDADKFEHLLTLEGHHSEVWCMALSAHGDFLVTGSHDRSLRRWERTDEPFFVEEEREKRLESMFEADVQVTPCSPLILCCNSVTVLPVVSGTLITSACCNKVLAKKSVNGSAMKRRPCILRRLDHSCLISLILWLQSVLSQIFSEHERCRIQAVVMCFCLLCAGPQWPAQRW